MTNTMYAAYLAADEVENHFHTRERWYGRLAGVNRVAGENLVTFQIASGNNAYGADVQILDSLDTPIVTDADITSYDLHRILITAASANTVYRVQLVWGTTAAAGRAAGQYSEIMYMNDAGATRRVPIEIRMRRLVKGTKMWARCWNATNLATIDFYFGIHEYNLPVDDD